MFGLDNARWNKIPTKRLSVHYLIMTPLGCPPKGRGEAENKLTMC